MNGDDSDDELTVDDLLEEPTDHDPDPGAGLFDGTEAATSPDFGTPDQPPLEAGDELGAVAAGDPAQLIKSVVFDLTFEEAHAILVGFLALYLGIVLDSWLLVTASVALSATALGLIGIGPLKRVRSAKSAVAVRWAVGHPHYFMGGQLAAVVAGGFTVALLDLITGLAELFGAGTVLLVASIALVVGLAAGLYRLLR